MKEADFSPRQFPLRRASVVKKKAFLPNVFVIRRVLGTEKPIYTFLLSTFLFICRTEKLINPSASSFHSGNSLSFLNKRAGMYFCFPLLRWFFTIRNVIAYLYPFTALSFQNYNGGLHFCFLMLCFPSRGGWNSVNVLLLPSVFVMKRSVRLSVSLCARYKVDDFRLCFFALRWFFSYWERWFVELLFFHNNCLIFII